MNDSENKSLFGSPPRSFHEEPKTELEKFTNISNTNLDVMEEKLQSIIIDENIMDEIIEIKKISDKLSEDINTCHVNTALIQGEIEYYKKKIDKRNEEINDINQLIKECIYTFNELETEKNEFTQNIINKHKAIKLATKYYKKRLNIYISVEKNNGYDFVKINMFTQENNDKFSFVFSINDNDKTMKLESTKPKISEAQFFEIEKKFKEEQNICALLCLMRKIFLTLV